MDPEVVVRAYYDSIDAHDYETFAGLLAPDVVHDRPDRTIEGRDTLVSFMSDDRPNKETSHELSRVEENGPTAAAEGRLLDADGEEMFGFEDVFTIEEGQITRIRTQTR